MLPVPDNSIGAWNDRTHLNANNNQQLTSDEHYQEANRLTAQFNADQKVNLL